MESDGRKKHGMGLDHGSNNLCMLLQRSTINKTGDWSNHRHGAIIHLPSKCFKVLDSRIVIFFQVNNRSVFLSLKVKQSWDITSQREDSDDRLWELNDFLILVQTGKCSSPCCHRNPDVAVLLSRSRWMVIHDATLSRNARNARNAADPQLNFTPDLFQLPGCYSVVWCWSCICSWIADNVEFEG